MINEPTAAAAGLRFHDRDDEELGRDRFGRLGTFDVTVMEVFSGTLEIRQCWRKPVGR
ncbi:MAG: hypothetical protein R3C05_29525 [Pirellulaceae bacterium]